MEDRSLYIRYRIYVNTANKADRKYPHRLCKQIRNLHSKLDDDYKFRDFENEKIKGKTFIPLQLENPGKKYYYLIGYIATYFECVAVWKRELIKGSTKHINTFTMYGYNQDMLLAYHYTSKIINALDSMRFNMRREYRRVKVNRRRRGENIKEKSNAITKSSNFFYNKLDNICNVWKEILENRQFTPKHTDKINSIYKHLEDKKVLDYRKYNYRNKPEIHNAFCNRGRFQNKRIITVYL